MILKMLFVFVINTACALAAAMPQSKQHLSKRAVTFGQVSANVAQSSVCSGAQRTFLEDRMGETVHLARAGSEALNSVIQALSDGTEHAKYVSLPAAERVRLQWTYYTFFGNVQQERDQPNIPQEQRITKEQQKARVRRMKDILDNIEALDVGTWLEQITIFCDSSYLQDTDPDGKKASELTPPLPPPGDKRTWKYDYHLQKWANVLTQSDCSLAGSTTAGHTDNLRSVNGGGAENPSDRITFCPNWVQNHPGSGSWAPDQGYKPGY